MKVQRLQQRYILRYHQRRSNSVEIKLLRHITHDVWSTKLRRANHITRCHFYRYFYTVDHILDILFFQNESWFRLLPFHLIRICRWKIKNICAETRGRRRSNSREDQRIQMKYGKNRKLVKKTDNVIDYCNYVNYICRRESLYKKDSDVYRWLTLHWLALWNS